VAEAISLTDWIQAIATVVALMISVGALRQSAAFRREELRGRLLGSLNEQLKCLRVHEQRSAELVQRTEATSILEKAELAPLHDAANELRAKARNGICELEPLLDSILNAKGWGIGRRLLAWRAQIDRHGTFLPMIDHRISGLSRQVDSARGRLPPR
jgi:hypothetical protein